MGLGFGAQGLGFGDLGFSVSLGSAGLARLVDLFSSSMGSRVCKMS